MPLNRISIKKNVSKKPLKRNNFKGFLRCLKGMICVPRKPKKPCAYQGCVALTDKRYCEVHQKLEAKRYNKYDRDPATHKRYGSTWKKIRATFLKSNPLCEICKNEHEQFVPATLAHHKKKLTDGGSNDWSNLMALCTSCHSRLHSKQGDYF